MGKQQRLKIIPRPSATRGHVDHGWIKAYYSFSFAEYTDKKHTQWGPLRVINEDRISKSRGFPEHEHDDFEIWTYLMKGELTHRDNLGHVETIGPGGIQYTSAGTGIRHSEVNDNKKKDCHLLQIWAKPSISGLKPTYYTRAHSPASKTSVLKPIVLPHASFPPNTTHETTVAGSETAKSDAPIPIHQDLAMYACILPPGETVTHTFGSFGGKCNNKRKGYIQIAQSSGYVPPNEEVKSGVKILLNGEVELGEGDTAYIDGATPGMEITIQNVGEKGGKKAEFIWFDMTADS
ncbi:hypothetical protein YB2330_006031 [Saitoella coloradoensis]